MSFLFKQSEESKSQESESKSEEIELSSITIQLGDIIQLVAPLDVNIHNKIFFINYLSQEIIKLISDDSTQYSIHLTNGNLDNKDITGINLLSRDKNIGYARQNNLLPGIWVDVFFGGDIPTTITGVITNLEEDMIELKTYPDDDVIYIDFEYKGIPLDIPIESILIREPPETTKEKIDYTKVIAKEGEGEEEFLQDSDLEEGEIRESTSPEEKGRVIEKVKIPIPTIKTQIKEMFIDADKILIGDELGEIIQVVDVPEYEQRFGIDKQTNDLLDELLSSVPNSQRTSVVLNNIHKMIERFKQLRNEFSKFDKYGNADMPDYQGANYKPLVNSLMNVNKKLYWLLPVCTNKKKIYDVEMDELKQDYNDVISLTLSKERSDEEDIINLYKSNSIPDGENKYNYLFRELNSHFTPVDKPSYSQQDYLTIKEVEDNINAIIDNLGDLKSSVVKNEAIFRRKFVIQTYNLGLSRLDTLETQTRKTYTKRIKLTMNDEVAIKSFISLPESALLYSHINLPGTNIFDKANLNMHNIQYWKALNKNTTVNSVVVDNLDNDIPYDETNYLKDIKEYILSESIDDPDKYRKYLNVIIPKTRILFELVKKNIKGKLSLNSIIKYLEPFLIYQKDLSFKQYQTIQQYIYDKIKEFKINYVNKSREFRSAYNILKYKQVPSPTLIHDLFSPGTLIDDSYEYYDISIRDMMTNYEALNKIYKFDNGQMLMCILSDEEYHLKDNKLIDDLVKDYKKIDDEYYDERDYNNPCFEYKLSKKYISLDELEDDNDKEIYFDKKYDTTDYGLLNHFKIEREKMSDVEFFNFIVGEIVNIQGTETNKAEREANSMLFGKRVVKNGDYAILILDDEISQYESINISKSSAIFKRIDNKWDLDESISANTFTDTNKSFCNIQETCLYDEKTTSKCNTLSLTSRRKDLVNADKTFNEYGYKYNEPFEEIMNKIGFLNITYKELIFLNNKRIIKHNQDILSISKLVNTYDIVSSPYSKLRDLIIGQKDFVKKQNDIIRFTNQYTREAIEGEDSHWRYCKEKNIKLLPLFYYILAKAFISGNNYYETFEKICAEQGTISDDGDAWVDKYSGYVIGKIDFDLEEGYDEQGFKINTRELIQKDISEKIGEEDIHKREYENPIAQQISNIVYAMTSFMGIELENKDFIVKHTLASQLNPNIMPVKSDYEKSIQSLIQKGKKVPNYEEAFNSSLIYLTLSHLLIGILISMPSITSKKTFPTCIKSFTGYPLTGDEDKSALIYISCVAHKIKSSIKPWNAISKVSQPNIASRMEIILQRYVLTNKDIQDKLEEKRNYLIEYKLEEIPKEHDIMNWINFLPPLRDIQMRTPMNVSSDFSSDFMNNMKKGNSKQHEQFNVIKSKIIHFSLAIQTLIQNIVAKEVPLLKSSNLEPFMENACCNYEGINTWEFFVKRENNIKIYNDIVTELSNINHDIEKMTKAVLLLDNRNTKLEMPPISQHFTEDTIYRSFIKYCNFNSILPIKESLRSICLGKPDDLNIDDDISEIIRKLKRDGKNYNLELLDKLMEIVNLNNSIKIHLDEPEFSLIQYLRDLSESANDGTVSYTNSTKTSDISKLPSESREWFLMQNTTFFEHLSNMLDTYDIALTEENENNRKLKNYIAKENETMMSTISTFLKANSNIRTSEINQIIENIKTITDFNLIENDTFNNPENATTYKSLQFIKNSLHNLISVYPNMILNKSDFNDIQIPKHWNLSSKHAIDIKTFISSSYSVIKKMYNDQDIKRILSKINGNLIIINELAKHTPFLSPVIMGTQEFYSLFDRRMALLLFNYYILKIYMTFINASDDRELLIQETKQSRLEIDTTTDVEFQESINKEIGELEIIEGEKKQLSNKICTLLIAYTEMILNEKKIINYNYEKIMEQVLRSKEKEKDNITHDLQRLTDNDREIENIFKNSKLEKWGVGLQKGLVKYAKETYDQERENMENRLLIDIELKKNLQVHEMNAEIYANDLLEKMKNDELFDKEAYDLADLPEDDDYGMREDYEDVEGYHYNMDDARYGYED
jgi:hypothetical protein